MCLSLITDKRLGTTKPGILSINDRQDFGELIGEFKIVLVI